MRSRSWILERRAAALVATVEDGVFSELRKLFIIEGDGLVTTCRRSNFFSEDEEFKFRDFELICRRGQEIHAIARFREWDTCHGFPGGREFVLSADARSQADYECAEMLMDHWEEFDHPMESGEPLIIFDRLVIAKPHPGIWPAITAAMDKTFKRRGGTMVLKAFTLEWEGASEGKPVSEEPMFARRLAAMKKLYKQRLRMQDVPDNAEGWMWKAIGHSTPPSTIRVRQPEELAADLEF
ncbi:hypothetical protein [Rhizobium sp. YS-1r]|uniref:hypothetical protein n=1 Tax=Rhizobium sp. YS-1r TaxID=1532558 RepID=UPI00050FB0B7|nr:hypothetical protein [Rhizobium sp. YS-1r]KGD87653.1 hypothetical protein JL39_25770 [Rhizobium sp. YS-1r]